MAFDVITEPSDLMPSLVVIGSGEFLINTDQSPDVPRIEFVEIARALNADIHSANFPKGFGGRSIPFADTKPLIASAFGAALIAGRYDAIYTTSEDIGIWLAIFLRLRRWRGRLIFVFHFVTPKKIKVLKALGPQAFTKVLTVSRSQAAILTTACQFPADKVASVFNWVDQGFFDPVKVVAQPNTEIMACGAENRDYQTLRDACALLSNVKLRIFGHGFFKTNTQTDYDEGNAIIDMPKVSYHDLRVAYGNARCTVVSLLPSNHAAGVTGLLEGMASQRPVVVTRTEGLADYLEVIPESLQANPSDANSLARAIDSLPIDEHELAELGARNRRWIEKHCSLDAYVSYIVSLMTGAENKASPVLSRR